MIKYIFCVVKVGLFFMIDHFLIFFINVISEIIHYHRQYCILRSESLCAFNCTFKWALYSNFFVFLFNSILPRLGLFFLPFCFLIKYVCISFLFEKKQHIELILVWMHFNLDETCKLVVKSWTQNVSKSLLMIVNCYNLYCNIFDLLDYLL